MKLILAMIQRWRRRRWQQQLFESLCIKIIFDKNKGMISRSRISNPFCSFEGEIPSSKISREVYIFFRLNFITTDFIEMRFID